MSKEDWTQWAAELETVNKNRPGLPRISIHHAATLKRTIPEGQKRASIILDLESRDMQEQACRSGVVYKGELFTARLYDYNCKVKRCFRCQKFGHSQGTCSAVEVCGFCGGRGHRAAGCTNKDQHQSPSCVGCGGKHPAWDINCRKVQTEREKAKAVRLSLLAKTQKLHELAPPQPRFDTPARQPDYIITEGRKRRANAALADNGSQILVAKPRGRPSGLDTAGRDPKQRNMFQFADTSQVRFGGSPGPNPSQRNSDTGAASSSSSQTLNDNQEPLSQRTWSTQEVDDIMDHDANAQLHREASIPPSHQ